MTARSRNESRQKSEHDRNGVSFQACLIRNLNVYKISSVVQQQQNATSILHMFRIEYIKTRGRQTDDPLKSAFIIRYPIPLSASIVWLLFL